MGLRPEKIFNRLNRARLDSTALGEFHDEIIEAFQNTRTAHSHWQQGASPRCLVETSQDFIDLLSRIFLVSPKELTLSDRARPHSRDRQGRVKSELFGSVSNTGDIRIYLLTPAREQPTAWKTYFNTLVHEWVHHYDFEALGDTVHCAGFYERVRTLYKFCLNSEPDPPREEDCALEESQS